MVNCYYYGLAQLRLEFGKVRRVMSPLKVFMIIIRETIEQQE